MKKVVIKVDDLYIKYKEYSTIKATQLLNKKNKPCYFDAINGVTFEVRKGDVVGIVGKNGSGKSTLLRALAGIYKPDSGTINTFDNRISLMTIGAGFVKNLSGRDNIYLSGILLGLSKKEIDKYINEIIEFSELGDFIDKQVKCYSTGMHSRLAFSISSTIKPDIILLDELLSVGDSSFKKKSSVRIKQMISDNDVTAIIVSHNTNSLKELCNKAIWIDKGCLIAAGESKKIISKYEKFVEGYKYAK